MKDVVVIIEPFGWLTLLFGLVVTFICGYVYGLIKGMDCNKDEIKFDFEKEQKPL